MTQEREQEIRARAEPVCFVCGEPADWGWVVDDGPATPYCWRHDESGDVAPIRAAWRRYNYACSAIEAAFDEDDQPTAEEHREREDARAALEEAIRAGERSQVEERIRAGFEKLVAGRYLVYDKYDTAHIALPSEEAIDEFRALIDPPAPVLSEDKDNGVGRG